MDADRCDQPCRPAADLVDATCRTCRDAAGRRAAAGVRYEARGRGPLTAEQARELASFSVPRL
jgi:hypothetical protein